MSFHRMAAIFVRQFFLYKSNPTRMVSIFLWLLIDIVQWGFISRYLGSLGQGTFGFITVILGAIILWGFMSRIEQGIMMAFLEDIWSQNFINFFASPLRIREYLGGLIMTSIASGAAGLVAMIALASAAFGYNVLRIGSLLLPFLLILLLFGISMGIFISAIIFRLGPLGGMARLAYTDGALDLCGRILPHLDPALLPAGHCKGDPAVVRLRELPGRPRNGTAAGGLCLDLTIGALLSTAYLIATSLLFVKVYERNLEKGSIPRFQAEAL